jgi:drug/metabolite transporter (DMT)-like permease
MKKQFISTVLLFVTALIWGFAFVAQVDGAEYLSPFTFNAIRFLLGAVALLPIVFIFEGGKEDKEEARRTRLASLMGGVALFVASTLQQYGIQYTKSAGISGFITGLYTVAVPVACFLIFKKKTGTHVWVGAVLAVLGLFCVCYKPESGLSFGMGEGMLLLGVFFWTAHVIIIDRLGKGVRSLHFACGQAAVCGVLSTVFALLLEQPQMSAVWGAKISLLFCGLFSVGIAYTLQVVAQKNADPTFASIILSTESVFSAVGGALFGIDKIEWIGYIGFVLIFAGIVLAQFSTTNDPSKKQNYKNDCVEKDEA